MKQTDTWKDREEANVRILEIIYRLGKEGR